MTGRAANVNDNTLYLMALSGKEFYDTVIDTVAIAAVVIRVRDQ